MAQGGDARRRRDGLKLQWLVAAYVLILPVGNFDLRTPADAPNAAVGVFLMGLFAARHFGQFNGGNQPAGQFQADGENR